MTDDTRERARQVAHELAAFATTKTRSEHELDITDALVAFANAENDSIRRLEAELTAAERAHDRLATIVDEFLGIQPVMAVDDLLTLLERGLWSERNAARNERIRWADRVEALAKEYAGGTNTMDLLDGAGRGGAASALLRLADELRAEGGRT